MKPEPIRTEPVVQEIPEFRVSKKDLVKTQEPDKEKLKEAIEKTRMKLDKMKDQETGLDADKIEEFVEALNYFTLAFDQKFKFRVYSETNSIWVRILDAQTDEVLREIPSRDALKLAAKIRDFMGILIDELA